MAKTRVSLTHIEKMNELQKQEFETLSKRVDDLTVKNEQRIEKLTFDVHAAFKNIPFDKLYYEQV